MNTSPASLAAPTAPSAGRVPVAPCGPDSLAASCPLVAPRWNLDSIFPGFDSNEFKAAKLRLAKLAADSVAHMEAAPAVAEADSVTASVTASANGKPFELWLLRALELQNESDALSRTLSSYCYAIYSTDTASARAMAETNSVDEIALPFAKAEVLFLNALAAREAEVRVLARTNPAIGEYAFYLEESLFWQKKQMTAAEEDLAADLARSGADAWGRLQEQLTSTADCLWDEKTGERKTLVDLRALAYDKDGAVREKAYRKELETCASIALPVAASLNGIKGTSIALNARRAWTGATVGTFALSPALEKSARQGRLSPKALGALIGAMEDSLPHWRRYLKAKARLLGKKSCAFYDLFAPVGGAFPEYKWEDVRRIVIDNFTSFSPRMGDFARNAFESSWIDGESRSGKVSGAYCTDMPLVKETRVLANFDGTFNSVTTVAHELGHAFHSDVLKDIPALQQDYPMTLAETASIFAETVVFESELASASDDAKLGLVEVHLQDGCQIIVDILSRFYFERSVFAARKDAELSVDALREAMTDAQKATYGDGLDAESLHPYMWLVKCHYYSSDLAFYNFPYAFGQLFGLALYARYRAEGSSFARVYEELLLETGRMDAVSLTARAGFDIESKEFWKSGIDVFVSQIDEFERIVEARL
jgi:pepF/M3 family oligoendopeptidase